jgi:dihydroflavonol-4-reductase
VTDTARAIVRLLATDISGQRYILNGDNWSWRHLFETIAARSSGRSLPRREATPFLAGIAWRVEKVKSLLNGRASLLTRESARVCRQQAHFFNNSKILRQLPDFRFHPLEESIRTACQAYLHSADSLLK